jgi:hypothetical protein
MTASAACVVATMPTWEQSKGIAHEIEFFRKARKPVFYLNPETLKVTL